MPQTITVPLGALKVVPEEVTAPLDQLQAEPEAPKGRDFKILGINIHVPPEERPRADTNIIGTESGSGIAPEDALIASQIVKRVGAAGGALVPRMLAAAREASPIVKYEAVRTGLHTAGIPEPVASIIAMAASGYRRGAKTAAAETTAAEATRPGMPVNATSTSMTPGPMLEPRPTAAPAETVSGGTPPPAGSPPAPTPGVRPKSPQQLLNEEAILRRRAAIQAQAAPVAAAPVEAPMSPAKATMTAEETKVYLQLRKHGVSDAVAREGILASRAMNERFGLSTPTPEQTEFPKGMRGKPSVKPSLIEAQKAAIRRSGEEE